MNLYLPIANLRVFQKGPEFFGIKVYNNLPEYKTVVQQLREI
jgi:hypothetical protein